MSVNRRSFIAAIWRALTKQRMFLAGSIIEYIVMSFVFVILTTAYTDFVVFDISNRLFTGEPGDGSGGFLWYAFAQPGLDLFLHHSDMVNYPDGEAIGGPTFITYFGLWIPIRLLTFLFGPVAGMNLFMVFGFVLTGLSMYWLVKKLTRTMPVALFAGFAAAYSPYAIQKALDHIAYILLYVFVFIIAAFIGVWNKPTIVRSAILGICVALAFYTDGYYILLGGVLVACLIVSGVVYGVVTKMTRVEVWARLRALIVAFAVFVVLVAPIGILQLSQGSEVKSSLEGRRSNIAQELAAYKGHVMDLLLPARSNPFLKNSATYREMWREKNLRSNASESTNYSGYVVYILCVTGVLLLVLALVLRNKKSRKISIQNRGNFLQSRRGRVFTLIGIVALITVPVVLSFLFSPEGSAFGIRVPLPGELFIKYNISYWRVLSRFFVVFHVVVVLFASITLWVLMGGFKGSEIKVQKKRKTWLMWAVCLVLTIIVGLEYATTSNRSGLAFSDFHSAYRWLARQDSIETVVEVPNVDPMSPWTANHVTMQIVHKKKLLNRKEDTSTRVASVYSETDNRELINWAYERGADAVIIHDHDCEPVDWGKLLYDGDNESTKACVYRLDRSYDADGFYLRYGDGFYNHRDNNKARARSRVTIEKSMANMVIVDNDLEPIKNDKTAHLHLAVTNESKASGHWTLRQNSTTIGQGSYTTGRDFNIDARVRVSGSISLSLTSDKGEAVPAGTLFFKAVVTD